MTIQEYLIEIENEDVRNRALLNARACGTLDTEAHNLKSAIHDGFAWVRTPEGREFWDIVYTLAK